MVPWAPLKKKLHPGTWGEAEPTLKGEETLAPTGGMNVEAQRGKLTVAGHVALAASCPPGNQSMCNPAL